MQSTINNKSVNDKRINSVIIVIIIIASVLGSMYGIYINLNNMECTTAIYLWLGSRTNEISLTVLFGIWVKSFKKIFLVWICSFYKLTYIVGYIILFTIIFSNGFTSVSLLMLWGREGIIGILVGESIQTVVIIGLIIEILNKNNYVPKKQKQISNNVLILIRSMIFSFITVLFDYFFISILVW